MEKFTPRRAESLTNDYSPEAVGAKFNTLTADQKKNLDYAFNKFGYDFEQITDTEILSGFKTSQLQELSAIAADITLNHNDPEIYKVSAEKIKTILNA